MVSRPCRKSSIILFTIYLCKVGGIYGRWYIIIFYVKGRGEGVLSIPCFSLSCSSGTMMPSSSSL